MYYDPETGTYITESGEIVEWDQVAELSDEIIDAGIPVIEAFGQSVLSGEVPEEQFVDAFMDILFGIYFQVYLLGLGGEEQEQDDDAGIVQGLVDSQRVFADAMVATGVLAAVLAGTIVAGEFFRRLRMYVRHGNAAFETGRAEGVARSGLYTEEKWNLGIAEHCTDCVANAGLGWQPVGFFATPGDGNTVCGSNCKCHKTYR